MRQWVWRNFAVSVWLWVGWWAALFIITRGAVYLLLAAVQLLAWVVAYRRIPVLGRTVAGILGAVALSIFAALVYASFLRGRCVSCLSPLNAALLIYIGASHLLFAALGRQEA